MTNNLDILKAKRTELSTLYRGQRKIFVEVEKVFTLARESMLDTMREVTRLDGKLAELDGRVIICKPRTPGRKTPPTSLTPNGAVKRKASASKMKLIKSALADLDEATQKIILAKYQKLTT